MPLSITDTTAKEALDTFRYKIESVVSGLAKAALFAAGSPATATRRRAAVSEGVRGRPSCTNARGPKVEEMI